MGHEVERAQPPVRGAGAGAGSGRAVRWCSWSTTCSGAMSRRSSSCTSWCGSASDVPLLVIGTARDEALRLDHPLHVDRRAAGDRRRWSRSTFLGSNTADALILARTRLLEPGADDDDGTQLVEDAEGSPLFLVELARSGLAHRQPATMTSRAPELPPKVQAVIEVRLAQLSAPPATGQGRRPSWGGPSTVDVVTTPATLQWRRCRGRPWTSCGGGASSASGASTPTTSATTRSAKSRTRRIGPARRRRLHRRGRRASRSSCTQTSIGPVAAQIAAHYDRAGAIEPAIEYYHRAIEAAQHVFAHKDVIRIARRGLELVERSSCWSWSATSASSRFSSPRRGAVRRVRAPSSSNELFARATALSSSGWLCRPSRRRCASVQMRRLLDGTSRSRTAAVASSGEGQGHGTIPSSSPRATTSAESAASGEVSSRVAPPPGAAHWPRISRSGRESTSNGSPRTPERCAWCA